MEINLNYIVKEFEKGGYPVQIMVDIDNPEPTLKIIAGPDLNGSLNVPLSFKEIADILDANNITGENGRLQEMLKDATENKNYHRLEERKNDLIYGTLHKYIYQMLKASINKTLFPDLVPLKHHKEVYWER
jgi:hypothetical protein